MCVSSDEQINIPDTALFINEDELPADNTRVRHTMGSLPTITAIFGLIIANATILYLSKLKNF